MDKKKNELKRALIIAPVIILLMVVGVFFVLQSTRHSPIKSNTVDDLSGNWK
jgi:hypothetical protein